MAKKLYSTQRRIYPTKAQEAAWREWLDELAYIKCEYYKAELKATEAWVAAGCPNKWDGWIENPYKAFAGLRTKVPAQAVNQCLRTARKQLIARAKAKTKTGGAGRFLYLRKAIERLDVQTSEYTKDGVFYPSKPKGRSWRGLSITLQASVTRPEGATSRRAVKIGSLLLKTDRRDLLPQASGYVSIRRDNHGLGRWYIMYTTPVKASQPVTAEDSGVVGVDVGQSPELLAASDGQMLATPMWLRLKAAQADGLQSKRDLAPRGSEERRQLGIRMRRMKASYRDGLKILVNTWARELARQYTTVVVEDLDHEQMRSNGKSKSMTRMASLTSPATMRNALQKAFEESSGEGSYQLVNPAYTSQACNACGTVDKASRKTGKYKCRGCGHEEHDDINAAKNIRDLFLGVEPLKSNIWQRRLDKERDNETRAEAPENEMLPAS